MGLIFKIGRVSSLSEARMAASLGPNFIGYQVSTKNPNAISPIQLSEIMAWVPETTAVAEIDGYSAADLSGLSEILGLNHFEINADFDTKNIEGLSLIGTGFLPNNDAQNHFALMEYHEFEAMNHHAKKRAIVILNAKMTSAQCNEIKSNAAGFQINFDPNLDFDDLEALVELMN